MNAVVPVKFDPSVPAYLQKTSLMAVSAAAVGGITAFQSPNRISIRAGRFHYVDTEGVETDVTENNGVALDVIVLDANPTVSKQFYEGAYNPAATEPVAPSCYSDNGSAPSDRAAKPQAATCAVCPHNVWGSKVTPTGSKIKACQDLKKVAVIPASNPTGAAYVLNIPAASLKPWQSFVALLTERGVPLSAMVIRLGFDTTASYPKLTYKPTAWLSPEQAQAVEGLVGSDETRALVGGNDTPIAALPAPAQQRAEPQVAQPVARANPAPPALPDLPAHTTAALQEHPKRVRRTKAQIEADEAAAQQRVGQQAKPEADPLDLPEFLQRQQNPAPAAAPVMQSSDANLDAMLDGIMGKA
jgi:hypothetical protein